MGPAETQPIYCDGCGQEASGEHLRRRNFRLELASRFRPVRINTLILTPEPPVEVEDFFYCPEGWPKDPQARALQEVLLESCGISLSGAKSRESALRDFQQKGFYWAGCVECPTGLSGDEEFDALARQMGPTLDRRIRYSYRPRSILLISERLIGVAKALGQAKLEAWLLVRDGSPLRLPQLGENATRGRFRADVEALLAGAA